MSDFVQAILAADVLLKQGDKILLNRRAGNVYASGYYDIPGGHVDEGETVPEAAVREIREELGVRIDIQDLKLAHVIERPVDEDGNRRLNFEFACEQWKGEPRIMEPDKCDDLRWVSANDLPDKTIPYTRQVIQAYSAGKQFSVFTEKTSLS